MCFLKTSNFTFSPIWDPTWAPLGDIFGPSWLLLGPSWGVSGPFGRLLESTWDHLRPVVYVLKIFGVILDSSCNILELFLDLSQTSWDRIATFRCHFDQVWFLIGSIWAVWAPSVALLHVELLCFIVTIHRLALLLLYLLHYALLSTNTCSACYYY